MAESGPPASRHPPYVGVVGPAEPDDRSLLEAASTAGRLLAAAGCVVVTGGLGGVMAAAASGARQGGGTAVALLPGTDRAEASAGHAIAIATGLGELRNALLVRSVDAVLAVGGSWGTLSEIALAVRTGVPVVSVRSWDLSRLNPAGDGAAGSLAGVTACATVQEAVDLVVGPGRRG